MAAKSINSNLQEYADNATMRDLSNALGLTEFTYVDNGYSGEQILEKYKIKTSQGWNSRSAEKNHTPEITAAEITSQYQSYYSRKNNLEDERAGNKVKNEVTNVPMIDNEEDIIDDILQAVNKENTNGSRAEDRETIHNFQMDILNA